MQGNVVAICGLNVILVYDDLFQFLVGLHDFDNCDELLVGYIALGDIDNLQRRVLVLQGSLYVNYALFSDRVLTHIQVF